MSLKKLLAGFLIVAGAAHFFKVDSYVKIVPPWVPYPEAVVLVSGGVCALLGFGLLVGGVSRWAAWGTIAYLVAVFPANVHMALHPEIFPEIPNWVSWTRLPLQAVFIGWAYRYTKS